VLRGCLCQARPLPPGEPALRLTLADAKMSIIPTRAYVIVLYHRCRSNPQRMFFTPSTSCNPSTFGFGVWRTDTVRVILVRDTGHRMTTSTAHGYDIALVTTDLTATAQEIIARYAARWSIEVTFFDVTNILGVGQARNRVPKAVRRTVPFGLFCHSILILWYALHGHDPHDATQDPATQRRTSAPCTRPIAPRGAVISGWR